MTRDTSHDLAHAREATLVSASELALRLGVTRSFVYEHSAELGAISLGNGPRPRLRFDPEQAIACYVSRRSPQPKTAQEAALRPRRRRLSGTKVELLPIRGRFQNEKPRRDAA